MAMRVMLATLSYVLLSMAVAWPWHMLLFHDLYAGWGAFSRGEPIVAFGMTAMLIQGLVIALVYPRYYRGGNPVLEGVKFSLLMGAVVYSVMGLATAAKFDINPAPLFLAYSAVFQLLQFTLTGIALGLIYRNLQANS